MNDVEAARNGEWAQHFSNASCYFSNLGRNYITSEERFVLELPTSRAMLATARLFVIIRR